jgi:hypothetical protein
MVGRFESIACSMPEGSFAYVAICRGGGIGFIGENRWTHFSTAAKRQLPLLGGFENGELDGIFV